jgi:hypothetical protein
MSQRKSELGEVLGKKVNRPGLTLLHMQIAFGG